MSLRRRLVLALLGIVVLLVRAVVRSREPSMAQRQLSAELDSAQLRLEDRQLLVQGHIVPDRGDHGRGRRRLRKGLFPSAGDQQREAGRADEDIPDHGLS
jgi:hypothetical protein